MFGSRGHGGGGGGGGLGGDVVMAMWNPSIKTGPNESGDSEVEFPLLPFIVGREDDRLKPERF